MYVYVPCVRYDMICHASCHALRHAVCDALCHALRRALRHALRHARRQVPAHQVTVFEGRDECRRLNVLKMWEETIGDLERLGLGFVDPDYCNGRDLRASTSRLQLALLKAALLLGVEMRVGVTAGPAG